eukprot:482893_1
MSMSASLNEQNSLSQLYGSILPGSDYHTDVSHLEDIYRKICDKFKKNAEDRDELDIYMVTAFLKYYHNETAHRHRWKYAFYCFKCLVCAAVQTFGMIAFLSYVIRSNWDDKKLECRMSGAWDLRTMAILFSLYISVWIENMILNLKSQGLYEFPAYLPSFLANEWVYIGLYSNAFTLMAATFGSFLLIYTADTTIDIVLNALALYFIVDLDNNLVDHVDYLRIATWMDKEFKYEDYLSKDQLSEVKYKKICFMRLQVAGRKGGCNRLKLIWVFFGGIFVYLSVIIGTICALVAPILIAVCY